MYFKKRYVHKCTWVSKINGEKKLIYYVLISRLFENKLKDLNVLRGAAGVMSDHYFVEAKLKVVTKYWGGGEGWRWLEQKNWGCKE